MMEADSSSNNGDEEREASWFKTGVMAFLFIFSIMVTGIAAYALYS